MPIDIYWIHELHPLKLAVMPKPRAGDWLADEIGQLRALGITQLVCLLEQSELRDLGLRDEAALCLQHDIAFVHFPIRDRGIPAALVSVQVLVGRMLETMQGGGGVAIHCRAGIGRTGLLAACLLRQVGWSADAALRVVSNSRGVIVPDTDEQRVWVERYRVQ